MTSSLVGSEMCIRDSLLGWPSGLPWPRPSPSPLPAPANLPRQSPPQPVSYTHLTLPTICSV
eukprot:3773469-Prorocentrum_lima.AAC.1